MATIHSRKQRPGVVFNFLINTLYIKEKGLQFAVSTQRARGRGGGGKED